MKRFGSIGLILVLMLVGVSWSANSHTEKPDKFPPFSFFVGTYDVIGSGLEGQRPYEGKGVIREKGEKLEIIRTINGRTVYGEGEVIGVGADKIPALQVRFKEGLKNYTATYCIGSDFDNYARLTGYVHSKGKKIKHGLEAWFIERSQEE